MSAADYDPNQDRREDEGKRIHDIDGHTDDVEMIVEEDEEEDLDDMFSVAATDKRKVKKIRRIVVCGHFVSAITPLTPI